MQTADIPPGKIRPVLDQVLVAADPPRELTEGGLVIPETSQQRSEAARGVDFGMGKGTVLAVGPGRRGRRGKRVRIPVSLKAGDRILYRRFAGRELTFDGHELRIVQEDDVFCTFEEDALSPEEKEAMWQHIVSRLGVPDLGMTHCPECDETDVVPAIDRDGFLECSFCKHVFMDPNGDSDEIAYAGDSE